MQICESRNGFRYLPNPSKIAVQDKGDIYGSAKAKISNLFYAYHFMRSTSLFEVYVSLQYLS